MAEELAEVTQEASIEAPPVENQEQSSIESQGETSQEQEKHLAGKNWWDPKSYGVDGMPPEVVEKLEKTLKLAQGNHDRIINEKLKDKPKYGFNSVQELKEILERDKNLLHEINETQVMEEETNERVQSAGFEQRKAVIQNWDNLNQGQKQLYVDNLTPEQFAIFKFEFKEHINDQKVEQDNQSRLEQANVEKYGDTYKSMGDQVAKFIANPVKNPREIAFKYINYEKYGEEMYNKGLRERGKLGSGLQTANGLGDSSGGNNTGGRKIDSIEDAFNAALQEKNTSADSFLAQFG